MSALQRGLPHLFQCCVRLSDRFSFGKHQQRLPWNQIPVHLPYQFAKYPLGAITTNGVTESFAHHDPDAAGLVTHPIGQQIEECR